MKFNWGTGIFIFYTLFAVVLFTAVYKSTFHNNSLVTEKYYAEDLKYQQHYNKVVNSQQLEKSLAILKNQDGLIEVNFPTNFQEVSGEIWLYHPSDKTLDLKIPVSMGEKHQQLIPTKGLMKTRWRVKIDWEAEGKFYYAETEIRL